MFAHSVHTQSQLVIQSARALIDAAAAVPKNRSESRALSAKVFASYMAFSDACFFTSTLDLGAASPFREWPAPLALAMLSVARYCDEALGLHAMITRQPAKPRRLGSIAHPEDARMLAEFAALVDALDDQLETFLIPLDAYVVQAMAMIRSDPWISNVVLAASIVGPGKTHYFNRHVVPKLKALGWIHLGKGKRWVFPGAPGPLQR